MMTWEEVVRTLEMMAIDIVGEMSALKTEDPMAELLRKRLEAINIAQEALRPVSQEQIERMFPGCDNCKPYCGTCENMYAWDKYGKPNQCADCKENGYKNYISESRFCEYCGKPLTSEAVEMMMERLEALHETE